MKLPAAAVVSVRRRCLFEWAHASAGPQSPMKAVAVDLSRRQIGLVDAPEPTLDSPTAVSLRTLDVGVCGTDRDIAAFEYGYPPPGDDGLVIGHEALAQVVDVGAGVTRVVPGDLVVPMVRRPCAHGECRPCRAGRQDFCQTGDYTERGIKQAHGFMAELFTDEERYLHPIPAPLRGCAVLVEPLTIAEKAIEEVWQIQRRLPWVDPDAAEHDRGRGLSAVVLGAGPVALLGAMTLLVRGFTTYVYSRSRVPNEKAGVAAAIGATYISSQDVAAEELAERVGGIDLVYEGAGVSALAFAVLATLGPNGILALTGLPPAGDATQLDTGALMRGLVLGNQVAVGAVNAGASSFTAAIADLEAFDRRWPGALPALITARHPIEAAHELLQRGQGGIKHVVAVGEAP